MSYFVDLSILLRNVRYRRLFIGQFISFLGTMITSVALPYQIYHETHSTLMIGLLSLFQLIPLLFTALIGGVLADRYHRKMILLIAEGLMGLGCLILAYNSLSAHPSILLMFIISPLMSAIFGLHRPALDSITQQLVDKKDYQAACMLATFVYSGGMIIGPALGGLIIAHYGIVITFLINFLSFAISWVAILLIDNIPRANANIEHPSPWASLKDGFQYAMRRQTLVGTYLVDFVAMIFGMPNALFPAIAHNYGGVETLGLLYSAPAIGALLISLFSGWTKSIKRHGAAIAISALIWGVAIIFFGFIHELWLALFFLAIAGAADAISGIFRQTMWNEIIPNEYRGRLSGMAMVSYLSGPKLGDTESGLVAAAFGVTASVISGGVLCVIGVGVCCYFLPKFWFYKTESEEHKIPA